MKVRKATPLDTAELSALNDHFNGKDAASKVHIFNALKNNAQEIVLVAVTDNKIIGFICGQIFKSMCYDSYYGEITELYVCDEYRRQGVAKKLIGMIERDFQTNCDICDYQLFTGAKNTSAQHLYEKCGYNKTQEIMYRKRSRDKN